MDKKIVAITIFLLLILVILIALTLYIKGNSDDNSSRLTTAEMIKACEESGGTWGELPNPCDHTCDYQRKILKGKKLFCAEVIVPGCQCGNNKCWNGRNCEPL